VRLIVEKTKRPQPDLTPMIDVVFLLIIFFMVATELKKVDLDRAIRLAEAEHVRTGYDTSASPIVVNVLSGEKPTDAQVRIGGADVSWAELDRMLDVETRLAGLTRDGVSPVRVLIRPDRDAPFVGLQRVMSACAQRKIVAVTIAAEKIDRSQ